MKGSGQKENKSIRRSLAILVVIFFSPAVACADDDRLDISKFSCDRCMPDRNSCTGPRFQNNIIIAEISKPRFEGYLSKYCLSDHDAPCSGYSTNSIYTFRKINFLRNDFQATEKTQFEAFSSFSTLDTEKWDGIRFDQDKSYVIIARQRGLFGMPSVIFACQQGDRGGKIK